MRGIVVLVRTKEPGGIGEPLFLDIVTALAGAVADGSRALMPRVIGGRYGLSSKDFTPAMAKAAFDELTKDKPRSGFTVGITDDVSHTSLAIDPGFNVDKSDVTSAVFYGLGADGTVGANKNTVKIIAEDAGRYAQGYFVYDSHKSGAQTISHLRFGPEPIEAPYQITQAGFVACHQFAALERQDLLRVAAPGATLLLNAPFAREQVWDQLSRPVQQTIIDRKLRLFTIDASAVAREVGLGARTNTVLQTCFFAISGVLPARRRSATSRSRYANPTRTRARPRWTRILPRWTARLPALAKWTSLPPSRAGVRCRHWCRPARPRSWRDVTARIFEGLGDELPVSLIPADGTFPLRNLGLRKAQHLRDRAGLARGSVRAMRSVQLRLPA